MMERVSSWVRVRRVPARERCIAATTGAKSASVMIRYPAATRSMRKERPESV